MSSGNISEESNQSSLIEIIVPTQQIAILENVRKNKITIPHRPRVKRNLIINQNNIKLDRTGKCILNKSVISLPLHRTELPFEAITKNLTCSRCNEPVIKTGSGKIKNIPIITSHGDGNCKNESFYKKRFCKKPLYSNKIINREAGDDGYNSFKTLHINRWFKSNWNKLTRFKSDNEILNKYTASANIKQAENEVVCNMMHEAKVGDFPFVIKPIDMPKDDLNAPPGGDDSNSAPGCCADACTCCKLACRIFGCKCKCKLPNCRGCCPHFPERTVSLNVIERAHLQNLYNTPCSSIQFSICNCAVQDALVKQHTTAAHYFAHKGLRQIDPCGHHHGRSISCSSSCTSVEYKSQKSYMAVSLASAVRKEYYNEDDDCCCKCCDMAMVSIDCQTDSHLHLQHLVQTEPLRKKCRPCCKCCKCNRKGGRCSISCKHLQIDKADAEASQREEHVRVTESGRKVHPGPPKGANLNRKLSPPCCNKCTGAPARFRDIIEKPQTRIPVEEYLHQRRYIAEPLERETRRITSTNDDDVSWRRRNNRCFRRRARGGADYQINECPSCKERLIGGTNNELFGEVVPGDEERFNIGSGESWLSRRNITKLLGLDKKTRKGFMLGKNDMCNVCNFGMRRQPYIAKKFNQKIDKKQLNKLLALRNMQQQLMMQNKIGALNQPEECDFLHNQFDQGGLYQQRNINEQLHNLMHQHHPLNFNQSEEVPRRHKPRKHQHHNHKKLECNNRRTLIYKSHSTQCITKTHDRSTSCLVDFAQALPTVKFDKYRKLFNEASGKFKSPISGREYNLKLEKVHYTKGVVTKDLPTLLEVDDSLHTLGKYSTNVFECTNNNDTIMDAICDAILLEKDIDIRAAGESAVTVLTPSSSCALNNSESVIEFDKINEHLVYGANIMADKNHGESNGEIADFFIQSNPMNNIFTNDKMLRNNSKEQFLKSAIFRCKNRLNSTSSTSVCFNKIKNNTNMSSAEFKSFIMNDELFKKSRRQISKGVLKQFNSYQMEDSVKNSDVIQLNPMENDLENVDLLENISRNIPNFIQENLSCFSNTISDTYSLIKILERNKEQFPKSPSFDEQIENVINYNSYIMDNS